MKTKIAKLLRNVPHIPAPDDLLERLQADVKLTGITRPRSVLRGWFAPSGGAVSLRRVACAVILAISCLIPLSYGTINVAKRLVIGSAGFDKFEGEFMLSKNLRIEMGVGTKEKQQIVSGGNIRFFEEHGEVLGTLRGWVGSWPKFKWQTKIELLSAKGKVLCSTEHVSENSGVNPADHGGRGGGYHRPLHFSLGKVDDISLAKSLKITMTKAPAELKTTAAAWIECSELDVVHGRVTGPSGKPVANAEVQIRELRKPGQKGIAAPSVTTDKDGYYIYDEIYWPYRVGVLLYEDLPGGKGYRHQYKRFNKSLHGSQTVNFAFDEIHKNNATLSGMVTEPDGKIIREFTIDARTKVENWKDYSTEYLYVFGHRMPFTTEDGKFEIDDLPAGEYRVSIYPTKNKLVFAGTKHYDCVLVNGKNTEIGPVIAYEKAYYGRVLFEDGSPAVSSLPKQETQIVKWEAGYREGHTVAMVDNNGYFTAYISADVMERLKSGKSWLTINISKTTYGHKVPKEKFPVELLASERAKAGVVKIKPPKVYYGRVLYETGKPAVPETAPWPGAQVYTCLRYTEATWNDGGITERIGAVDSMGYFNAYLTDEQMKNLRSGKLKIQIYHPKLEEKMVSYPIGYFPADLLALSKNKAKGYKIPYDGRSSEFKNLRNIHNSTEKLKALYAMLSAYSAAHQGQYPVDLGDLKAYDKNDLLQWNTENVRYKGIGIKTCQSGQTVLAYDVSLLKKAQGTTVLFSDGQVNFYRPRQLQTLGIVKSKEKSKEVRSAP